MASETYHRDLLKQVIASKYLKEKRRRTVARATHHQDLLKKLISSKYLKKRATHHQDFLKELLASVARVAEIGHSGDQQRVGVPLAA